MPKVDINEFDRNNNNAGKESKRWKGLKQDSSGKYLVYVTDTSERLFEDLDSAVQYLKEAAIKEDIKKEASKENAVVQRGQENLDGLKEVITRKKLVQTADGRYKVMESKRYNMKSDDSTDAKNKLRNVDRAKEQAEELPEEDAFKDVKNEIPGSTEGKKQKRDLSHKTSSIKYGPVGTCLNCHCQIFPPNTDMDHWLNRQLPADLYCPVCGYGIGTPGNFNYDNAVMNEQSVDNLIKGASLTEEEITKVRDSYKGTNPQDFTSQDIENDIKFDFPNYEESDFERVTGMSKDKYDSLASLLKEVEKTDQIIDNIEKLHYAIKECIDNNFVFDEDEELSSYVAYKNTILKDALSLANKFLAELDTKIAELKKQKQDIENQYASLLKGNILDN